MIQKQLRSQTDLIHRMGDDPQKPEPSKYPNVRVNFLPLYSLVPSRSVVLSLPVITPLGVK